MNQADRLFGELVAGVESGAPLDNERYVVVMRILNDFGRDCAAPSFVVLDDEKMTPALMRICPIRGSVIDQESAEDRSFD